MGLNISASLLSPAEEAFLRALLWEEGHLQRGPATQEAEKRQFSLLRCLEPVNRLSPNFQGEALNRIREDACPAADWPWGERSGEEALRLLWARLAQSNANPWSVHSTTTADLESPQRNELRPL